MTLNSQDTKELSPSQVQRQNRRKLVGLFSIAFVPMLIAYGLFFYFPSLIPASTINEGELIQPPIDGAVLELIEPTALPVGLWTLLIPVDSHCDDLCVQSLYLSRQIVIGLGKDADRVQRVALLEGPAGNGLKTLLETEHPNLLPFTYNAEALTGALQARSQPMVPNEPVILLMDPNGNIMMWYPYAKIGMPLHKDLRHLLKISAIG